MRHILLGFVLLLAACGGNENSPENEVREWIARGELATEEKDRSELLDMISVNYRDAHGHDRKQVGDLLRLYFLRQNSIALLTSIDEISMSGDTAAKVKLTIGMAGTTDSALRFDADAYNFEFELIKPDSEWLLIGAQWGRLGRELL